MILSTLVGFVLISTFRRSMIAARITGDGDDRDECNHVKCGLLRKGTQLILIFTFRPWSKLAEQVKVMIAKKAKKLFLILPSVPDRSWQNRATKGSTGWRCIQDQPPLLPRLKASTINKFIKGFNNRYLYKDTFIFIWKYCQFNSQFQQKLQQLFNHHHHHHHHHHKHIHHLADKRDCPCTDPGRQYPHEDTSSFPSDRRTVLFELGNLTHMWRCKRSMLSTQSFRMCRRGPANTQIQRVTNTETHKYSNTHKLKYPVRRRRGIEGGFTRTSRHVWRAHLFLHKLVIASSPAGLYWLPEIQKTVYLNRRNTNTKYLYSLLLMEIPLPQETEHPLHWLQVVRVQPGSGMFSTWKNELWILWT